ncbi:MAG: DUF2828 family protein [Spartobacteria bacterium]|nr:DUF2828 family protein [Spartobacteria bacterium]
MSAHSNIVMKEGVKGSDVYESTGDPRVDLSVMLVRGLTADKVAAGMEAVLAMPLKEALEDLCVLLFQTRNIRGGKGERTLAYDMLEALDKKQHALSLALLPLFSHYGCWRDLFKLALNVSFTEAVMDLVVKQFALDNAALVTEGGKVSLLAKWAPREKSHGGPLAKILAKRLFADSLVISEKLKMYRKMVSALNKHIDTVEVKMCDRHFADIEPGHVPGRALQKYRRAFLNQLSTWQDGKRVQRPSSGDRSTEYDRVEAGQHFSEHFHKGANGEVVIKGSDTVYPHEVVEAVYLADGSEAERNLRLGQWLAFVAKAREGGALKHCLAMCDFSGSMDGLPKMVSLALGLLIAEVSGSNKILTFDSEPKWHTFDPKHDLYQKVASVGAYVGQGLSTDFQKAMDLVLTDIKERRCRPEEVPKDLIVFTDMGWDEACSSSEQSRFTENTYSHCVKTEQWQTHIQMIRENFRRAGEDLHGVPFVPPRIVIWNLRAAYSDFHARADEEGVVMLSGWSPALFKVLQEKGIEVLTPYAALRLQLDDPMYQPVRDLVRKHVAENKGIFSYWQ